MTKTKKIILSILIIVLLLSVQSMRIETKTIKTNFTPQFQKAKIETFVTPDCSYNAIKKVIAIANKTLRIMVYEFWHPNLTKHLEEALNKGIKIYLLLEGDVYGYSGDNWNRDTMHKLYQLNQTGKPIHVKIETTGAYLHTKLIIADEKVVFISSENFLPNSYPENPNQPNTTPYNTPSRGWGVIIHSQDIAQEYLQLFNTVYNGASSKYYDPSSEGRGKSPEAKNTVTYTPTTQIKTFDAYLYPVYTPKNSLETIKWMISKANYTIFLDLMYIDTGTNEVQQLINELIKAKERGVTIQAILEDDFADYFEPVYQELTKHGIHIVKAFDKSETLFLHNKGIIIDDKLILVGSINWSKDALTSNWEAGILIKSTQTALYYKKVFANDWDKSSYEPFDSDGDGLSDWYEKEHKYNPYNPDTDNDGINDWEEVYTQGNKYSNYEGINKQTLLAITIIAIILAVVMVITIYKIKGKRG